MSTPYSHVLLTSSQQPPQHHPECGALFTPVSWDDLYKKAGENVQVTSRLSVRSPEQDRPKQEIQADNPSRSLTCVASPPNYTLKFDLSPPLLFANPSSLPSPQPESRTLSSAHATQPGTYVLSPSLTPRPPNPLLSVPPLQSAKPLLSAATLQQVANPPFSTSSFAQSTKRPGSAAHVHQPSKPPLSQWLFANPRQLCSTEPEPPSLSAPCVPSQHDSTGRSCSVALEEETSSGRRTNQESVVDAFNTMLSTEGLKPAGDMESSLPALEEEGEQHQDGLDAANGALRTIDAEELNGDRGPGGATLWEIPPEDVAQPQLPIAPRRAYAEEEEWKEERQQRAQEEKQHQELEERAMGASSMGTINQAMQAEEFKGDPVAMGATFCELPPRDQAQYELVAAPWQTCAQEEPDGDKEKGVADANNGAFRKMYVEELKGDLVAEDATFWRMPLKDLERPEVQNAPLPTWVEKQTGIADNLSSSSVPLAGSGSNLSLATSGNGASLVASRGSPLLAWSSSRSALHHAFHKTHTGTDALVKQNKPVNHAPRGDHDVPHSAWDDPVLADDISDTPAAVAKYKSDDHAEHWGNESIHTALESSGHRRLLSTAKSLSALESTDRGTRSRGESPHPALLAHPGAVEYLSRKLGAKHTTISVSAPRDTTPTPDSCALAHGHVGRTGNIAVQTHTVASRLRQKVSSGAPMSGKGTCAAPRERVDRQRWRRSFLRSVGARGSAPSLMATNARGSASPVTATVSGSSVVRTSHFCPTPPVESTLSTHRRSTAVWNDAVVQCEGENGVDRVSVPENETTIKVVRKNPTLCIDQNDLVDATRIASVDAPPQTRLESPSRKMDTMTSIQAGAHENLPRVCLHKNIQGVPESLAAAQTGMVSLRIPQSEAFTRTAAHHVATDRGASPKTPQQQTIEPVCDVSPVSTVPIQEVSPTSTVIILERSPVSTPGFQEGPPATIEPLRKPPSVQVTGSTQEAEESEGFLDVTPERKSPSSDKERSIPRGRSLLYHALQHPRVTATLSGPSPPAEPISKTQLSPRRLSSSSPRRSNQPSTTSHLLSLQQSANMPRDFPRQQENRSDLFHPHRPPNASPLAAHQAEDALPLPSHERDSASSLSRLPTGRASPLVPQQLTNPSPCPPHQRDSASSFSFQHSGRTSPLEPQQLTNPSPCPPHQRDGASSFSFQHSGRTSPLGPQQLTNASPCPPHQRDGASSFSFQQSGRTSPLGPQQLTNASPRVPHQRDSTSSLSFQQNGRTSPFGPQQWGTASHRLSLSSQQPESTRLFHKPNPSLANAQRPHESQTSHRCRVVPPPCTSTSSVQQRSSLEGALRLAPTMAQSPPVPQGSTVICKTPRFPGTPQWPAPHLTAKKMSGAATPTLGVKGLIRPAVLSAPTWPQAL